MKLSKQAKIIIFILTLLSVYLYFTRLEVIKSSNAKEIKDLRDNIERLKDLKYEYDKTYYILKDSLNVVKKNLKDSKTKINEKTTIFFDSDFDDAFYILSNRIQADSNRTRYKSIRD
jgi:hypothetical protein